MLSKLHILYDKNTDLIPDIFLKEFEDLRFECIDIRKTYSLSSYHQIQISLEPPSEHYYQTKLVHGARVVQASGEKTLEADGLYVCSNEACILAMTTADCLSLGFYSLKDDLPFVALVHAGWRGLTQGIINETIKVFLEQYPKASLQDLGVIIGPAIFGENYETDKQSEFLNWTKSWGILESSLIQQSLNLKESGKLNPDLQLLALLNLKYLGLLSIFLIRENTYGHPFLKSHRYAITQNTQSLKLRHYTFLKIQGGSLN